jgi:hypothetical protein
MAAADLIHLDSLFQRPEDLQEASIISQPDQPTFNVNGTMTFCHDCGLDEWKFGDEEMSFCPSSPHVESLESLATDIPFLDLANHLPNDDGLSYTVEQDYNDGTEEDTSSWLDLAEFLDFEANTSQNSPPWTAPAGQRSRTSTEDPCNYVTGSTHDSSTLASSTPTSSSNTGADTRDLSTTLESQHCENSSSLTFLREATKDKEVNDLIADETYALPKLSNPPISYLANDKHNTPPPIIVDLTQDDTDDPNDDDEKTNSWYDDDRDAIDYGYRSPYESNYDTSSPISDLSYQKPGNFIVTEVIQNEKHYLWDHRCKKYRNGVSYATPNHKDTVLVIRDGGSDIPIELTYEGSGIWEGCNYRIGAAISDHMAKSMVFKRESLSLKRKRGCMYSDDLRRHKRVRESG